MLVKFLSFIASILGTNRYKPVVFSCFALLLASSGIWAIVAFHQPQITPATSQTIPAKDEVSRPERQSSQLGVPRQQLAENPELQPVSPKETSATSPTASSQQANTSNSEPQTSSTGSTTDLILQIANISMSAGSTSSPISMSSSDNTKLEWTVEAQGDNSQLQILMDPLKEAVSGIRMRLKANSDTPAGTYSFLVTAKDTARSLNLSKTLTVTVNH